MSDFKLLVFDWDGTLMDSEGRIVACIEAAIGDLGLPARELEEMRNIIGLGLREAIDTLYPGASETVHRQMVERYRHHYLGSGGIPTPMFDGAAETLHGLAERGYFLAVATGKGRVGLDRAMESSGVAQYFHATRCADETFSKPHPQMLLEVMDAVGAEPAETLMIGDTEYDMQMAVNAGTAALAVSYGVHAPERLMCQNPLGCIHDITEIIDWLDGLARNA